MTIQWINLNLQPSLKEPNNCTRNVVSNGLFSGTEANILFTCNQRNDLDRLFRLSMTSLSWIKILYFEILDDRVTPWTQILLAYTNLDTAVTHL
jgi:hypothetical protein